MHNIIVAAKLENQKELDDLSHRLYHHFSFLDNLKITVFLSDCFTPKKSEVPQNFGVIASDKKIAEFMEKITFLTVKDRKDIEKVAKESNIILIYSEDYYKIHSSNFKINSPKLYWCDPVKTRQEGSNYIQAALDCMPEIVKKNNENESLKKLIGLRQLLISKYSETVVLATGPSIEKFRKYDYSDKLVIACNSTILNKELVEYTQPRILVFADPIFHFGVSQYAEQFREICKEFLNKNKDVFLIVPFKYYALLKSLLPSNEKQIIGVPFTKHRPINLDINEDNFYTFTTSNILTLLLLPLATTFSQKINIIGCDGRSLEDNTYFWNHGQSVQINEKMDNIKQCHPGFFNIDYNEYYFEHCHTLDNFISYAELKGKKFVHLGNTYIPALAARAVNNNLSLDLKERFPEDIQHLIIEPDGMNKSSGHYQDWHFLLGRELSDIGKHKISILSRIDAEYLGDEFEIIKIFTTRSWELQRGYKTTKIPSFPFNEQGNHFFEALKTLVADHFSKNETPLHLFMYYGSVQAVGCLLELQKSFPDKMIFFSVCIFHESVNFDPQIPKDNFHSETKKILMEAAARMPYFRLFAVTEKLSDVIYREYEVKLNVMIHSLVDVETASKVVKNFKRVKSEKIFREKIEVFLPSRLDYEKSIEGLFDVLFDLLKIDKIISLKLRNTKEAKDFLSNIKNDEVFTVLR